MTSLKHVRLYLTCLLFMLAIFVFSGQPSAGEVFRFDVTVKGTDAIYLAGRSDVATIPEPDGNPNAFILKRASIITIEFPLKESFPTLLPIPDGDVGQALVRVFNVRGAVSFGNGFGRGVKNPTGAGGTSDIEPLGGISGFRGPNGSLVGVFLDDEVPLSGPPATLDFSTGGIGTDFSSLAPVLGQVFYIGDGVGKVIKAPVGATRLAIGIADASFFVGPPGYYEDNNGRYQLSVEISIAGNTAYAETEPEIIADIDGNGTVDAATDGKLLLRQLFGFSAEQLVASAIDLESCRRCNAHSVLLHIQHHRNQFDLDGNGVLNALSDGILLMRYLLGYRGSKLTDQAVDLAKCQRCDASSIEDYLEILTNPIQKTRRVTNSAGI